MKKIKKVLIGLLSFVAGFSKKVFAGDELFTNAANMIKNDKYASSKPLYGVESPENGLTIWERIINIIRNIFSPIVVCIITIIGLIVFWKKSKLAQNIKIYITVIIVILAATYIFLTR